MTNQENKALYIAQECRKAGMTLAGAAGVLANVEAESVFSSTNVQDTSEHQVGNDAAYTAKVDSGRYNNFADDDAGYGLAQWTLASRKAALLSYAKKQGKSIGDFKMQVEFLINEMRSGYANTWRVCTTSNDPYKCGYEICMDYERPAEKEKKANYRGGLAQKWYNWLSFADNRGEQATAPEDQYIKTDDDGLSDPLTWPPRTIDFHCTDFSEIKLLQELLLLHGYNVLTDGIWRNNLTEKVKIFQKANGLDADGVVGKNTWIALGLNPAIFERR